MSGIPRAENFREEGSSAEDLEGKALLILGAYWAGLGDELPANNPATLAMTEREIRAFHDMATKLADHIDHLHQPAVAAMFAEGMDPFTLRAKLREAAELAQHAFSSAEGFRSPGAPRKAVAANVTETARYVFEEISGRQATFTTDPATSAVSGFWPDFLGKVFDALGVDASVASQVRAASGKSA